MKIPPHRLSRSSPFSPPLQILLFVSATAAPLLPLPSRSRGRHHSSILRRGALEAAAAPLLLLWRARPRSAAAARLSASICASI